MFTQAQKIKLSMNQLLLFVANILVILVIFLIGTYFRDTYDLSIRWTKVISMCSISTFLYQMIVLKALKFKITSFQIWFIFFSHFFMFSRIYLNAAHLDGEIFWDLLSRYPVNTMFDSGIIILLLIQSIFTGLTTISIRKKNNTNDISETDNDNHYKTYKVGLILTLVSIPCRLFIDINTIVFSQNQSSYSQVAFTGPVDDIAFLFVPGILYLISSKRLNHRRGLGIILYTTLYFISIMILTGDRRYPVSAIIALFLCYITVYDIELKGKQLFIFGFFSYVFLNLIAIIRDIRGSNLTGIKSFFTEYGELLFSANPMIETLSEFGLSFFSVVNVVKNVPEYIPYQNGLGFFGALPSLLPVGFIFNDFFKKVSISLRTNMLEGYPVGSTIYGDLYANYGMFSIIFGIFLGYILSKIFKIRYDLKVSYHIAKYFSFFYILINLIRASFFELFRVSVIIYLVPVIILYFMNNNKKNIQ